jgi:hypothetical protein
MRLRDSSALVPLVGLLSLSALGCGSGGPAGPGLSSDPESGYFESAASGGNSRGAAPELNGRGLTAGDSNASGDAAREIAEADIIQQRGTTLYAMSRSGGLSLIDVSQPSSLKIIGRYRTSFTPFEMYVKDEIVFAMYSDWGQFVQQEGSDEWVWKQTSQLLALDASDPAHIAKLGEFELPGEISDSRLVGDVLYAVSYQNGSCWACEAGHPSTNVVSINVAKPEAPVKVDELSFEDESPEYGWGKRSISVTPERIYIAGPEYGAQQPENSTIQVVDISDAQGDLEPGTSLTVKGQITSRWQMDELDGTLRVISQPWAWWNSSVAPALETFTITSSQQIDKLAHLDMVLPEREQLRSVRFDGTRGYAVTAVQQDPLFTFDLSDPAAPKQMGELVMPGFLYHMEPRGDRLVALGFDQGNGLGAITVSLFDVSNLVEPTLLKRVNFGGSWGQLPEDQDRIHKAFNIDRENSLILTPFSGWQPDDVSGRYCGKSLNGVQLIDFADDDLVLRGMVSSLGEARRAFVAGGALFTVAEQEVAAYDISDRSQPKALSGVPLALNVSLTLPTADKLVRLRQDWYSESMRLEVVPQSSADALLADISFDLTAYLREKHGLQPCSYWYPSNEPLFVVGGTVWTLINDYGYWDETKQAGRPRALLIGFSPETGEVTGSLELPFSAGYWGWGNTSRVVKGDVALLMQDGWDEAGNTRSLVALDLSDAAQPKLAYSMALPADDYYGSTGLLESGNEIVTSYARSLANPDAVRNFALRIDVTDPLAPSLIGSYNVPGYVVDFDAEQAVAITLDHQPLTLAGSSYEDCAAKLPNGYFDGTSLCIGHSATLKRVSLAGAQAKILDSARIDELAWSTPRRADGRLFFGNGYYGRALPTADVGFGGYYGWSWAAQQITVVDSATLVHATLETPGVWSSVPSGTSLILAPSAGQPLTVIDGSDAEHPTLWESEETALGYTRHLAVSGKDVFLAQGDGGVQHLSLP